MGFESGSVSFRMFHVPGGLKGDYLRKFAAKAAPPLDALGKEGISGWVSGRHLLDRQIGEDNAIIAGYTRLTLMKAERKIPKALLYAECKMEELAELQARGAATLDRAARSEIKKDVIERLLPTMPPTLTGIPLVYDPRDQVLYASAMSGKQVDALALMFGETTGQTLAPMTPESAALQRKRVNVRDLDPTSYAPEGDDATAGDSLGQDFLTWLWFYSEVRGGLLSVDGASPFGIVVEGPLTFVLEGEGAHETILRKGLPQLSAEAQTALLSGKKLRRARLTLARGEETWSVTIDADDFAFRGLKLPPGEKLDFTSRFEERMLSLGAFRDAMLGFFDSFLDERGDAKKWARTLKDVRQWVGSRQARR